MGYGVREYTCACPAAHPGHVPHVLQVQYRRHQVYPSGTTDNEQSTPVPGRASVPPPIPLRSGLWFPGPLAATLLTASASSTWAAQMDGVEKPGWRRGGWPPRPLQGWAQQRATQHRERAGGGGAPAQWYPSQAGPSSTHGGSPEIRAPRQSQARICWAAVPISRSPSTCAPSCFFPRWPMADGPRSPVPSPNLAATLSRDAIERLIGYLAQVALLPQVLALPPKYRYRPT